MNNYYSNYVERDDNVPGYIYIMEADGFHGFIPGKLVKYKRIKIGLSRNPNARENTLNSNQPPCNINLIDYVYVYKMKDAESYLHQIFGSCHVKLKKSKEWYDFNYFQYNSLVSEIKKMKNNPDWSPLAKQGFMRMKLNLRGKLIVFLLTSLFFGSAIVAINLRISQQTQFNRVQRYNNQ